MFLDKKLIKKLFDYARQSIKYGFEGKEFIPKNIPKEFYIKRGVFTTLLINGNLRGCIGIIEPIEIWKGVIYSAYESAFNDPRFPPLTPEEFNLISIEISILDKPVKTSRDDIKPGDGVIVRQGFKSALFLPQVWEIFPDKDEFLKNLFLKAGISSGKVEYYKFKAYVFEENNQ